MTASAPFWPSLETFRSIKSKARKLPPRGCSSASTPPLSHRRQEPCSASGSRFPALPPPWPQMWSLRKAASHHNQIWHVKPFGDDVGHGRHADLQNELARGIVVGDVASEGTEGGSKIITGIPTKFVSAAFGCELQVYHDGTACSALGRLIHPFQQKFDIWRVISGQIYGL